MHKCSFQSVSKHVHVIVIINDYKSGEDIEHTSPKIKYYPIEFVVASINEDINCICCTPFASPNAADKYIIMHQLKPFKQYIYPKNKQLDGMNEMYVKNNAFLKDYFGKMK